MSEEEICKISCSFSSLIETGKVRIIVSSTCAQLQDRSLSIVPMLFATLFPMSSSLHLTFVFFLPFLTLSFSPYSFYAPLSLPSPISFLPSFLPPISPPYHPYLPLVSSPSLPSPVLALSLITDTTIRTKGQHVGSGLGTLGSKRRPLCALVHPRPATTVCCSPWLPSELPQLRDRHNSSLQKKEQRGR